MLRATIRTKLYRIPGAARDDDWPLPGERSRLRGPLQTYGSPDSPDEFDLRERVPEEFSYDESPQQEGKRVSAIEKAIADAYDGFERVEEDSSGDSTKTEDNED
ncbi:hypothetical protein M197_gp45 [Haloarcula hispanica tailed virus 2]|uniref:Uncharacterized protein n=1 Tax=Haloarcula hispanica tailed virus 2 TaxID=1273751 RepID=R4T8J8_9CAUD|nr:hypothetical protein M197_gp45 [Haloarcula hispanica tailed virus 2]AGM11210.1 hypothetical protein HHTV2_45 [Haloarcula hispanica tailed virus 2]